MSIQHKIMWAGTLGLFALWGSALTRHQASANSPPTDSPTGLGLPHIEATTSPALDAPPERRPFARAEQDPFVAPLSAMPLTAAQPAPFLPPTMAPPPHAPPLNVRVVGRTHSAELPLAVYAMDGAGVVLLSEGKTVSSGHRVSRVTQAGVEFVHPLLSQPAVLPLPDYPKQEIR